jgi:HSP20 family molecular chaperone IbpA
MDNLLTRFRDGISRLSAGSRVTIRSELPRADLPPESTRRPTADVFESGSQLLLLVDLPGSKHEDIEVALVGDELSVRAPITEPPAQGQTWLRSFAVPAVIDCERARASWTKGVLRIQLPKRQGTSTRIPVAA